MVPSIAQNMVGLCTSYTSERLVGLAGGPLMPSICFLLVPLLRTRAHLQVDQLPEVFQDAKEACKAATAAKRAAPVQSKGECVAALHMALEQVPARTKRAMYGHI